MNQQRETNREGAEAMLKKIFGGIKMAWPLLILFAVISGLVTGLIALIVPEGNSFRQIAVTFEAWIVLAIIVVVNCERPLEAACKTFVYFLISQPLVYLVQVPFNSMGFGLFWFTETTEDDICRMRSFPRFQAQCCSFTIL